MTVEAGLLLDGRLAERRSSDRHGTRTSSRRSRVRTCGVGSQITEPVTRARLYATRARRYELELNGHRVGDHVLAPGWTSYHHQLRYDTFDVTDAVQQGENVIGAVLGDGWYRGALVENLQRNRYGDRLGLLCQLEITHADGTTTVVVSDDTWRSVDRTDPRSRAVRR